MVSTSAGMLSIVSPSNVYPTPTGISANVSKTSSLVTANPVRPLTRTAYRTTTASNHPHRRGLPVVAPNSPPNSRIRSATTGSASVGSGPLPTRVVYAFTTPSTASIAVGPMPTPTAAPPAVVWEALERGESVLLEGAQGALLDVDHGTYPYVTSSNTTAGGAAVGVGIGPTAIDAVLGVVKAYTTRVGNGPLPTEAQPKVAERIRELGGEFGATTGRPRRCGWFDAGVVRYAVRVNGLTGLAVTKLDVLDTFAEIPVGVGYKLDGETIARMPADAETIGRVEPIYETVPGWQKPLTSVRRLADLPPAARAYVDRLQDLAGAPVRYVSVGTRRDQIIEV